MAKRTPITRQRHGIPDSYREQRQAQYQSVMETRGRMAAFRLAQEDEARYERLLAASQSPRARKRYRVLLRDVKEVARSLQIHRSNLHT